MPEIDRKFIQQPSFIWQASEDDSFGYIDAIVNSYGLANGALNPLPNNYFAQSLAELGSPADIKVLNSHQWESIWDQLGTCVEIRELARADMPTSWLKKHKEITGGLFTKSRYEIATDIGRHVYLKLLNDIAEYSIGFSPNDVDPGDSASVGESGTLFEYSPVIWGANGETGRIEFILKPRPITLNSDGEGADKAVDKLAEEPAPEPEESPADIDGYESEAVDKTPDKLHDLKTYKAARTGAVNKLAQNTDALVASIERQFYEQHPDTESHFWWVFDVYLDKLFARNFMDPVGLRFWRFDIQVAPDWTCTFSETPVSVRPDWKEYGFDSDPATLLPRYEASIEVEKPTAKAGFTEKDEAYIRAQMGRIS